MHKEECNFKVKARVILIVVLTVSQNVRSAPSYVSAIIREKRLPSLVINCAGLRQSLAI